MDSDLSSNLDLAPSIGKKSNINRETEDFENLLKDDNQQSPSNLDLVPNLGKKSNINHETEDRFAIYGSISRHDDRSSSPAEAVYGGSPRERTDDMGVEDACDLNNTWDDDANLMVPEASFPTPLPPSSSYNDLNQTSRAESPNYNADFGQLFNPDPNADVLEKSKPGVCGVSNLGNTCFMNSGLQCLLNTPPLVQLFLGHVKDTSASDTLATHFANLLQKVWSGSYSKVKPTEFQVAFANQHVQFKDYRQHDCQEFLALLLGTLHELLNTASNKSSVSDLSADPMSPRSVCEESAIPATDSVETDSTSQLAFVGVRCEISSSSSRSSESSIGVSRFKKLSIPPNVTEGSTADGPDEATKDSDMCCDNESNLIPECALKRDCKVVNVASDLNNRQPSLSDIIHKDTKTSNVNVVVPETAPNNHVVFDSDKFPKSDVSRRRELADPRNFTASYDFEEKTGSKRMINNELDIGMENTSDYGSCDSSGYNVNNKRCKLEEPLEAEKNQVMECALKLGLADKLRADARGMCAGASLTCDTTALHAVDDDIEADKQWDKHTGLNQSIIVDSFQGQFKSTVVCSECRHSSSTYEPFMYLSVPLPHAMEQQVAVTFVPASSAPPTKFLITLNRQDKVVHIKQQLRALLYAHESMALEMAEVLDHHIARILDENQLIRCISSYDRSIYAFEMSEENTGIEVDMFGYVPLDLTDQTNLNNSGGRKPETDAKISTLANDLQSQVQYEPEESGIATVKTEAECLGMRLSEKSEEPKSCTICLDDAERPMKNHIGCSCYLCEGCIEMSLKHYKDSKEDEKPDGVMNCPVCNALITPDVDMVDASESCQEQTAARMLNLPVLFRADLSTSDCIEPVHQLFGHPHLIRVPNSISASALHNIISRLVPCEIDNYSVLLVDGQGYHCSRCLYTAGCRGCQVPRSGDVTLRPSDNLAVNFVSAVLELPLIEHESLHNLRKQENLSIYDCLSAFCESEKLDEHNPWYCPSCECNQSATKTLSVWRYPDFLIVYLKRFVFYEYTSVKLDNKVSFPLTDLKLPSNQPGMTLSFDLYACVNHIGGASAGHYTAHAKNPQSGEWHLFNDETVTSQMPQESDFSNAYILFYQIQKQGLQQSNHIPCLTSSTNANDPELPFAFVSDPLSCAGQSSLV